MTVKENCAIAQTVFLSIVATMCLGITVLGTGFVVSYFKNENGTSQR